MLTASRVGGIRGKISQTKENKLFYSKNNNSFTKLSTKQITTFSHQLFSSPLHFTHKTFPLNFPLKSTQQFKLNNSSHNNNYYTLHRKYSTNNNEEVNKEEKKEEIKQKRTLKEAFVHYGKIGMITHITLSLISLAGWVTVIQLGIIDPAGIAAKLGVQNSGEWLNGSVSTFAIAYLIHKATALIRTPISLFCIPIVAHYVNSAQSKLQITSQPPPSPSSSSPQHPDK